MFGCVRRGFAVLWLFALTLGICGVAIAAVPTGEKPRPPCGVEPYPNYPALGAPPSIVLWTEADLKGWTPPACTAWKGGSATLAAGLAGRFRDASDTNAMLARIGAISSLRSVSYWSITDKRWNTLFTRASALEGADPKK